MNEVLESASDGAAPDIHPVRQGDLPALLALNNADAEMLSPLDADELRRLGEAAFFARAAGGADAFILAFDQDAPYRSPNFLWFRERYARFVYVDRVVVAPAARKRGLARRLYAALFDAARASGHWLVVCEVNIAPPNPASDEFHAALGFAPVGTATLGAGGKSVRYLLHDLGAETPRDASDQGAQRVDAMESSR